MISADLEAAKTRDTLIRLINAASGALMMHDMGLTVNCPSDPPLEPDQMILQNFLIEELKEEWDFNQTCR